MNVIRNMINNKSGKNILALLLGLSALPASAQIPGTSEQGLVFWFSMGVIVFLLFVILFMLNVISIFMKQLKQEKGETVVKSKFWTAVQVNAEGQELTEEELLHHHEYDGIRELDNRLPPWWVYMFYATIVFSVIYIGYYHFSGGGDLQKAEYDKEISLAEEHKKKMEALGIGGISEKNVSLVTDKTKLESGMTIFTQNCAACHGRAGEGGVGPNLTDEYWIHGGGIKNVFKTIKAGVPEKGMIPWQSQLSASQIQEVASYILSIQGSKPANAKAPQGDVYKE